MRKPVVILIFAHKPEPDAFELISLRQCWSVLGGHPVRLVCPEGMDTAVYRETAPGLQADFIPPRHLSSLRAYNRLKIGSWLYERYQDFEFLLTHELDAFVFRDELSSWCAAGWDYIGAPWFEGFMEAAPDAPPLPGGNSGFSLRRIASCRRVLGSLRPVFSPRQALANWRRHGRLSAGSLLHAARLVAREGLFHPRFNRFHDNEDLFWSRRAPASFPWFRVADYETARSFSFEANPERLLAETRGKLPFGCHKWQEKNLGFWRPHIEARGHLLPA